MHMKLLRRSLFSLMGYIFVSLSATGLDFLFFGIFAEVFDLFFPILYVAISTVLARIISDSYKYYMDRNVVFKAKGPSTIIRFFALATSKTILSSIFVTLLVMEFGDFETICKMIVDFTLFFPGYYLEKRLVHGVVQ